MHRILFVTDPYLEPLLAGAVAFASRHGWVLDSLMRRNGRLPGNSRPDGILATVEFAEVAAWLAGFSCPIVQMLDIRSDPRSRHAKVVPDYQAAGRQGAEHLLELGRPAVAFYRRFDAPDSNAVMASFVRTMHAAGRTVIRLDFPDAYPGEPCSGPLLRIAEEAWEELLRDQLRRLPKPCAVMAEDDRCGAQLIRLARACGFRVPDDLAVLGCDDHHPDVDMAQVPMSSIDTNLHDVGFSAARMLQQLIECRRPHLGPVMIAPRGVVARASTAAYVCDDLRIAGVVRRIRSEFREDLTVTGLARGAGMSVRSLQVGFKAALGRSLRDELVRCRMAHAERLLEETELKLQAVSAECGLGGVKSLSRFFHLRHGRTPQAFRLAVRAKGREAVGRG